MLRTRPGPPSPTRPLPQPNRDTGVKYTTTTSSGGEYRINNVPVGRYNISAAAPGMATATKGDVSMELNHTTAVNLTLQVGSLSTVVEVEEAGATIDTSTAQLQSTFDSKSAVDVPLSGISRVVGTSGIYNLSLTSAGVATSGGVGQGTGPSIS